MDEAAVEIVAQALCEADGLDPHLDFSGPDERWKPNWHEYRDFARAAIAAYEAAQPASSPAPDMVEVTQADRDAAADYMELAKWSCCSVIDTRAGFADYPNPVHLNEGQLVQAFARHRIASYEAAQPPAPHPFDVFGHDWDGINPPSPSQAASRPALRS